MKSSAKILTALENVNVHVDHSALNAPRGGSSDSERQHGYSIYLLLFLLINVNSESA